MYQLLFFLSQVAISSAQGIVEYLTSTGGFDITLGHIASSPELFKVVSNAENFTFLAIPDGAWDNALLGEDQETTAATIAYHLLHGIHDLPYLSTVPQFISSAFRNFSATGGVTGGTLVEASRAVDGTTTFKSGMGISSVVISKRISISGGIVFIIDKMMRLPPNIAYTNPGALLYKLVNNYFQNLGDSPDYDFLNQLVKGPDRTFFIPSSSLPNMTFGSRPSMERFLSHHTIKGEVHCSSSLIGGQILKMASGLNLVVSRVDNGDILIHGVKVIEADILISNGVIHLIDGPLPEDGADSSTPPTNTSPKSSPSPSQASTVIAHSQSVTVKSSPGAVSGTKVLIKTSAVSTITLDRPTASAGNQPPATTDRELSTTATSAPSIRPPNRLHSSIAIYAGLGGGFGLTLVLVVAIIVGIRMWRRSQPIVEENVQEYHVRHEIDGRIIAPYEMSSGHLSEIVELEGKIDKDAVPTSWHGTE